MQTGKISLATGPMFSGKTEWLISQLQNYKNKNILAIRYTLDNRYSKTSISSHNGKKLKAESAANLKDVENLIKNNPGFDVVGIDEIQFFEPKLANYFKFLRQKGAVLLAAGLNVDYLNDPWETTKKITKIADEIYNLVAVCAICKKRTATLTQRTKNSEERIIIGGSSIYEPRCLKDYQMPDLG